MFAQRSRPSFFSQTETPHLVNLTTQTHSCSYNQKKQDLIKRSNGSKSAVKRKESHRNMGIISDLYKFSTAKGLF